MNLKILLVIVCILTSCSTNRLRSSSAIKEDISKSILYQGLRSMYFESDNCSKNTYLNNFRKTKNNEYLLKSGVCHFVSGEKEKAFYLYRRVFHLAKATTLKDKALLRMAAWYSSQGMSFAGVELLKRVESKKLRGIANYNLLKFYLGMNDRVKVKYYLSVLTKNYKSDYVVDMLVSIVNFVYKEKIMKAKKSSLEIVEYLMNKEGFQEKGPIFDLIGNIRKSFFN